MQQYTSQEWRDTRFLGSPSGRAYKETPGAGEKAERGRGWAWLSPPFGPPKLGRCPHPGPCPTPAHRTAFEEAGTKSQSCG